MTKSARNNTKVIVIFFLFTILCAWALSPLWVNPCISTHLSEEEIKQFLDPFEYTTLEERAKDEQYYGEKEIPCGAQDLPLFEKLEASRFQGKILSEMEVLRPLVLRSEFTGIVENTDLYHYRGYTFFSSRSLTPLLAAQGMRKSPFGPETKRRIK